MNKNNKQYIVGAVFLTGALLGSTSAFAAEGCTYETLVSNVIEGIDQFNAGLKADPTPTANTTVCVDEPVRLMKSHMLYNLDTPVTTDGTATGTPAGLRHMWMLGMANIARAKGVLKASKGTTNLLPNFHIRGILHGSALSWALSDAWWQKQVDEDGIQLYPDGNPNKAWIEKVIGLKDQSVASEHLDIQLEVCGVTLMGKGLSNDDVYPGIRVNQGAFGRISALEQEGYTTVQEGWIDNDSMYELNDDEDKRGHKDGHK